MFADCIFVTSDSGKFTYESTNNDPTVCGVYLITDPDKKVELNFLSFDVPCEQDGLVSVIIYIFFHSFLLLKPTKTFFFITMM